MSELESMPPKYQVVVNGKYQCWTRKGIDKFIENHNKQFPEDIIDLSKRSRGTYEHVFDEFD